MLFFDNFSSLLGILSAMLTAPMIACSFTFTANDGEPNYPAYYQAFADMVFQRVCPGIGCALLFGNIWYAIMAAKLSRKENRSDVTALPYGVNAPAGFLMVYMVRDATVVALHTPSGCWSPPPAAAVPHTSPDAPPLCPKVMLPLCFKNSPYVEFKFNGKPVSELLSPEDFAWEAFAAACCANLIGGLFEVCGIGLAQIIRRNVPRAALFAPICGVGFVWLGLSPLIDVMREPLIGLLPLALCFTGFFANGGKGIYPARVPAALVIFAVGTALWWSGEPYPRRGSDVACTDSRRVHGTPPQASLAGTPRTATAAARPVARAT